MVIFVFNVLFLVLLLLKHVWAITTPKGRVGDGGFLPSGGTRCPTPRNFTPPNPFSFLFVSSSLPRFLRSNAPFGRVSQVRIKQMFRVVCRMGFVFDFSPRCASLSF